MSLTYTDICEFGTSAPDFRLLATDNQWWALQDCTGSNGTLVMFICNHCPYVKAINHKLVRDARELQQLGIGMVAIMSNDAERYPVDSLENMRQTALEQQYPFPYLMDETQQVAKSYGAVCTPDFFAYNADLELQYRGRLDASGARTDVGDVRRDLFLAMQQIGKTGKGPIDQIPSMGCSIKWR